jgi:guanine deaminase
MQDTIFKALVINPLSADEVQFGNFLVVSGEKIIAVEDEDPRVRHPHARVEDLEGKIIMPGLVDTHVHLPQFPNIGIGGELELLDWLEKYTFPAERRFENVEYARSVAEVFFRELIANGTTAASVFATIHEKATSAAFEAAKNLGIRANIGKVMMDRNAPTYLTETLEQSIAATERLALKWDGKANGRLHYTVTPRFAPTSTPKQLSAAARISETGKLRIQTHLSENKGEIAWVKELFKDTPNYTQVYQDFGLLGRGSIMAHSIYLSDGEISMLKSSQTGIAHCPCSNTFLHSGIMPYTKYKSHGLIMGLGSDISGGYDPSIFGQMRAGIEVSKVAKLHLGQEGYMKATDALYLATLGGAKVLNLDSEIGNFEKGKQADFLVVSDPNTLGKLNFSQTPREVLLRVCYAATKEHVERVYVQGKQIK